MSVAKLQIVRHYARAKWNFQHLRGPRLQAYQARRARAMVQVAVSRSPFYREHWQGCDLNDWQNLPLVNKALMMANFDTFNTVGVGREEALAVALRAEQSRDFAPTINGYTVGLSSGTSGHRGLFVVSAEEQAAWAGTLLARVLPRIRRQGWRVALFLRSNSNLYEQVGSRLITFRYFDLMQPVAEAAAQLAAYQPDILVAPPSHLARLANCHTGDISNGELSSGGTSVGGISEGKGNVSPEMVIAVAEVLGVEERGQFQEEFGSSVGEIYQATEGLIGVTCSCSSLHVQEDVVGVQFSPLDAAQPRYVTPIVTDLWRATQPILRYALGDIWIMENKPCPCGSAFRVIKRVLGRVEDILYFPSLEAPSVRRAVFPDQVHAFVYPETAAVASDFSLIELPVPPDASATRHIQNYRAVQERVGHLRIHLDVPPECFVAASAWLRASIEFQMNYLGCRCEELQIARDVNPEPPNVKRQWVRNLSKSNTMYV